MSNAPPFSRNPAGDGSLIGAFRLILDKALYYTDDMLPAEVISYNRTTNRARVQIVISMVTTAGEIVTRSQIASVPVFQYGGGGFVVSCPVTTGDTGWLKANDRDISAWKQNKRQSTPPTQRKHSFSDAMFFPDTLLDGYTIAEEDAGSLVIQNKAGTVKMALSQSGIKFLGPVEIIGGLTVDGIPYDTHKHTGVTTGSGQTGGPVA